MKSAHTDVFRRPAHDTLTEVMLSCTEMISNCDYFDNILFSETCSTIGGPVHSGFQPEIGSNRMDQSQLKEEAPKSMKIK